MKCSAVLAVILSASLPSSAFAQNYSASRAASAAPSGVSGAAGTISIVPAGFGAISPPSLTVPSMTPAPGAGLAPVLTPVLNLQAVAPSAAAIPALPAALNAARPAAAASSLPLKLSPLIPAALFAAPSATSKPETAAAKTWTEKLSVMFDGGTAKEKSPADPSKLKAFIVRHGQPMTEITLDEAVAHGGQVRLLVAKNDPSGLSEKDAERVKAMIAAKGVNAAVSNEKIAVDWSVPLQRQVVGALPRHTARSPASLGSKLTWPLREAKFLAQTFVASLVKPLPSEVFGGLATKSFPIVTSIGVYWAAVGLAHPLVFAGLVTLTLVQGIFHGVFLKSWNNFQEVLSRERGFNYQMFFNLSYVQIFGTMYRLLSWTANPASVTPPWSANYWKDMAVMSVAGTFFGVMGYNGLNALYAKGSIKRWQHSGIQQMRDLLMLLAGPFFASGSMTMFWAIFVFQQSLDLAIAIWAGAAKPRPIVFIASAAVAASAEFKAKYPAEGVVLVLPLQQAWQAVTGNPLARLMTWPARALWKLVRRGNK